MTAKHLLDQIVRGLDGVTAGPWAVDGYSTDAVIYMPTGESHVSQWKHLAKCGTAEGHWRHNAAHIARCSPDTMREIAAYVRDLEERLAKAAEALEKFTGHYEPWMDRWDDDAESSTFSRHTFGQLRSARAIISQIRSEK